MYCVVLYYIVLYCGRVQAANTPGCTADQRLIVQTLVLSRSYLHRQVSPPETLVMRGGIILGEKWPVILTESCDFHAYTFGFFYMLQICDMEQTVLIPFRRKMCPEKSKWLRRGLNQRTWVPKASTLLIDHRSRFHNT